MSDGQFSNSPSVINLTTDKGSEFISRVWKSLMNEHNVKHVTAEEGDHRKMGMIERFNRTIKALISKYQTAYQTKKWIDVLPDLVENYNSSVHASTGYAPVNVGMKEHALIRLVAAQKTHRLDQHKDVDVGDRVRLLLRKKNLFGKEGPVWSDQVYTVVDDNVKSFKVEGIDRRFKHYELMKVDDPAQKNPYQREVKSFDVEKHLAKARKTKRTSINQPIERRVTRSATGSQKPRARDSQFISD